MRQLPTAAHDTPVRKCASTCLLPHSLPCRLGHGHAMATAQLHVTVAAARRVAAFVAVRVASLVFMWLPLYEPRQPPLCPHPVGRAHDPVWSCPRIRSRRSRSRSRRGPRRTAQDLYYAHGLFDMLACVIR